MMPAVLDKQYIDDHDVVERYLADQLSEPERESFEAYFLEHPEAVQEMNRTAKFKSALMDLQESGRLQPLLATKSAGRRTLTWVVIALLLAGLAAIILSRL